MASSADGKLILFENDKSLQTIKLQGEKLVVRFINHEVVSVAKKGKLTILNQKLEVLKMVEAETTQLDNLAGNDNLIIFSDTSGFIWYYNKKFNDSQQVSANIEKNLNYDS